MANYLEEKYNNKVCVIAALIKNKQQNVSVIIVLSAHWRALRFHAASK